VRGNGHEGTTPPEEFGVDFLDWFRWATEHAWADLEEPPADQFGLYWRRGTRWTGGLGERAIADVEDRYGLRFPPDYRLFLSTLHSTTPWMRGAGYVDDEHVEPFEAPGFYDWQHDEPQIRDAMAEVADVMTELPYDGQAWQRTWLLSDPKPMLIPVFGHRYLVADDTQWILSIVGHDAIIYNESLRDYLLVVMDTVMG
jgi:hypothetical protein